MITLAPWLSFVPSFLIADLDDWHVFVAFVIRF